MFNTVNERQRRQQSYNNTGNESHALQRRTHFLHAANTKKVMMPTMPLPQCISETNPMGLQCDSVFGMKRYTHANTSI